MVSSELKFSIGSQKAYEHTDTGVGKLRDQLGWSREEAISVYTSMRLAHLLFPENTPNPVSVQPDTKRTDRASFLINVEDIPHDENHTIISKLRIKYGGFAPAKFSTDRKLYNKLVQDVESTKEFEELKTKMLDSGLVVENRGGIEMKGHNVITFGRDSIIIDFRPAVMVHLDVNRQDLKDNPSSFLNFDLDKLVSYVRVNCSQVQKKLIQDELNTCRQMLPEFAQRYFGDRFFI